MKEIHLEFRILSLHWSASVLPDEQTGCSQKPSMTTINFIILIILLCLFQASLSSTNFHIVNQPAFRVTQIKSVV